MLKHYSLCAFLLDSSTASRGTMLESSNLCVHFYVFLLCISIVFLLFSAYYPLLFQHYFPLCIAFHYAFPMIVKPPSHIRMIKNLNPLQQPKKWNLSTMLTATKQVKPFLLALATCISAALDCSGLLLGTVEACFLLESDQRMPSSGFRMPSSGFRMPSRVQNAIFRRFSGTSAGPPCRHEASVTESQKRN